jgi:hypothetical protein
MSSARDNQPPFGSFRDPLQSYKEFNVSLGAITQLARFQESLLPFKQFEEAIRPLAAIKRLQDSLVPLKQFENFASFQTTVLGLNTASSALLKSQLPNVQLPGIATFKDVQTALGVPIENIRRLTDLASGEVALDSDALDEFEQTVDSATGADAPHLLYDRLLWLPSIAQRRVYLAALWALKELVSYVELETNVPPPGHVLQLVSLLWAVAFAMSELIEYESPDR